MSEREVVAKTASVVVIQVAGYLQAQCVCGSKVQQQNQGLGRATIGAWKSRHRDCHLTAAQPEQTEPTTGGDR